MTKSERLCSGYTFTMRYIAILMILFLTASSAVSAAVSCCAVSFPSPGEQEVSYPNSDHERVHNQTTPCHSAATENSSSYTSSDINPTVPVDCDCETCVQLSIVKVAMTESTDASAPPNFLAKPFVTQRSSDIYHPPKPRA